jgi:hypothetical protein
MIGVCCRMSYRVRIIQCIKLSPTFANSNQRFAKHIHLRALAEVRVNDGWEVYRQLPERCSMAGDITHVRPRHRVWAKLHVSPDCSYVWNQFHITSLQFLEKLERDWKLFLHRFTYLYIEWLLESPKTVFRCFIRVPSRSLITAKLVIIFQSNFRYISRKNIMENTLWALLLICLHITGTDSLTKFDQN